MIHFAKVAPPIIPKRRYILWLARVLAGVIFAMFVVQLMKLPELIDSYNAFVVWAVLGIELLALPFLLNLPLSKVFHWVSWGMGWLVSASGVAVACMALSIATIRNDCYVNDTPNGTRAVEGASVQPDVTCSLLYPFLPYFIIGFLIIFTWISWAMWPGGRAKWRRKAIVTAIMIVVSWVVWFGSGFVSGLFSQ